jgi:hypothetical protein
MTKKEKEQKIDGYDPKLDGVKKGKIIYKDGKKFYQASDGSLHTGQVEDYERELKADKAMKKSKKPSPNKQAKPDFLDLDGDGNKTESMKKASADKKGSPSKQTEKQKKNLPPNLVKEIAKAKGNASPAKQKSKLLPSEHPDTYVYEGNLHIEKVNDLEDRISFIREDMFNETGDSVQQKKDIATLQKQLKKLKANKPKASVPNKMKSPAKQRGEIKTRADKGIPVRPGYLGKLVREAPKFEQHEYEPMMVGRYPDRTPGSNSKKKKTKVGKFLSKITKRKKKK